MSTRTKNGDGRCVRMRWAGLTAGNAIPRSGRRAVLAAAIGATLLANPLRAGQSTNSSSSPSLNDTNYPNTPPQHNPAETISIGGSTAIRNFITSPGATLLNPGDSITLSNGPGGAPVTYTAPSGNTTFFQLASPNFTNGDVVSGATQTHSALRFEYHEAGATEGVLEVINDQIGYLNNTPLIPVSERNPIFTGGRFSNPIWVNTNIWDGTTTGKSVGSTVGSGSTINGLFLANSDYNNYSTSTYNAAGLNLQGGQNRVQMGVADMNGVQALSIAGTSSSNATPMAAGYGKGNNASGLTFAGLTLPSNGPATPGAYYQLQDQSVANMGTNKIDPAAGSAYAAGPWNTAGVNNLQSTRIAVTATVFAANPGTGLTQLNRGDVQWLQTTGRLQNGADFNMTTRDLGSGTRNVSANNTGVDPSWAVGENDAGNGLNLLTGQTAQDQENIGSAMLFSNKTSGGGQLIQTVQNNRMAIGTLGLSDFMKTSAHSTASLPLRAMAYSDTPTDAGANFVPVSASSITDGSYVIYQNETFVTVKAPTAANAGLTQAQWAALTDAQTGIKGDNATNDVAAFRGNITTSVNRFPAASVGNPADQLLATGFVLPQMMMVEKNVDGLNQSTANPSFNSTLRNEFLASSYAANFTPDSASSVTSGVGSTYGNAGNNTALFNGQIPITAQNYLFGNFNQNGVRDFSAVQTALGAAKTLYNSGAGTSIFTADGGMPNSTSVPISTFPSATKGDLIVMGDYNGDGKFDGRDIYALAHGAALADSAGGTMLTSASGATFADQVRNGVLVKNAALNYMQANTADATYNAQGQPTNASAFLRETASRNPVNDPLGTNAFNIYDVNGDGKVDRNDAAIIAHFEGQSYTNLPQQLAATINTNGTLQAGTQKPFNLVDAQLIDGESAISEADLKQFMTANPNAVIPGDLNFDGSVNSADLQIMLFNLNKPGTYVQGDINFDGVVNSADLQIMLFNLNQTQVPAALWAEAEAAVPEPGVLGTLAVGLLVIGLRRRRA